MDLNRTHRNMCAECWFVFFISSVKCRLFLDQFNITVLFVVHTRIAGKAKRMYKRSAYARSRARLWPRAMFDEPTECWRNENKSKKKLQNGEKELNKERKEREASESYVKMII